MFAKIIGAIMLVIGIGMTLSSIGMVVVGVFSFIALAVKVALVVGLVYVAWRLINNANVLPKILGAFLLVGGISLAFPVAGALIAGTFGAIGLAIKVVITSLLVYFGWRWLKHGTFSTPSRSEMRNFRA
jgi:hypothetical protein